MEAGKWPELRWSAYHVFSYGVLGGCTNETLNGKVVQVTAPYSGPKQNATQTRLLDGQWRKNSDNLTTEDDPEKSKDASEDDPESDAALLGTGSLFGGSAWEVLRSWAMVGTGVWSRALCYNALAGCVMG